MIVGYARVSTDGQSVEAQQAQLRAAGAERIFAEKISGTVTDRRQLGNAIASLGAGDCLLVTRLDRLARSTRDLLNVLASISDKGAGFKSLVAWCLAWHSTHLRGSRSPRRRSSDAAKRLRAPRPRSRRRQDPRAPEPPSGRTGNR